MYDPLSGTEVIRILSTSNRVSMGKATENGGLARLGSLRIWEFPRSYLRAAFSLSLSLSQMALCSILLTSKTLYRFRSLTSVPLSNHHCYGALPPFSGYHPLSWTIIPFLHTSLQNELVGDGGRWRRRRDQAIVTKRGPRQTG